MAGRGHSVEQAVRMSVIVWLLSTPTFVFAADVITGTLVSFTPENGRFVLQDKAKKVNRTFTLAKTAQVTLDGAKVPLGRLEEGQSVTVFYTGTMASRLIARTEKSDANSKPKPSGESDIGKSARSSTTPPSSKSTASTPSRPIRPPTKSEISDVSTSGWPQFRGPNRDNISTETGLLGTWPNGGPPQAWATDGLGEGYSSVAVSDGKLFTMGNQGDREAVLAFDLVSGNQLWATPSGRAYQEGQGNGPRGTPTIDGERVYALGANGDLVCLDVGTGQQHWHINILQEFGANNIQWGISESVLIDGEKLICTPGGRQATMAAINKNTGRVMWRSVVPGTPSAAYSSAIAVDVGGVRQYVNFTHNGVIGVRASDGQPMWGQRESANGTANCSTPVFEDNTVFTASGYDTGGALFRLQSRGGQTTAQLGYRTDKMKNHHGGMVVVDGFLYGSSDPGILTCLNLKTGQVAWQNRSVGKGSLTAADAHLYLRSENGPVALIEINPQQYVETGRFDQPRRSGRPAWAHPVVADGKLFLRDMDRLLAYQLRSN